MGLEPWSKTAEPLKCIRQYRAANSVTLFSWTGAETEAGAAWQLGNAVGLPAPVVRVELCVGLAEWEMVRVKLGVVTEVADVVSVDADGVTLSVGPEI